MQRLSIDDARWRDFVARHPDATPFHDPAWALLLAECYGMSGFVMARVDESGAVTAGIPVLAPPRLPGGARRLVSLPFTDSLAPLVGIADARSFGADANSMRRELGISRIELRCAFEGADRTHSSAVIHTLGLVEDPEAVALGFTKGKRRDVRASERKGLDIRRAESEHDVTETYFRLHLETRRRLGVPSQPRRFFRLLWGHMLEPGHGFTLIVRQNGDAVAGAVFLVANGTMVYKYSASDARRRTDMPNDLIIWSAMKDACRSGLTRFDFGRSELAATGLRQFKSRWGAVEEPLVYSTIGDADGTASSRGNDMLGTILRRSPIWVTRATGELLYRYAA
jgi:CelD/BcsL family acetyltransferase involved in cellulose biosynthesis